jgi:hypothetical protein
MATLYLTEARARALYVCSSCQRHIARGSVYFRHDPAPYAHWARGQRSSRWCRQCIIASDPGEKDRYSGRIKVPAIRVLEANGQLVGPERSIFEPLRVELVSVSSVIWQQLQGDASAMHQLSPTQFEELICDRLFAMGFEPKRVGATNERDGGVDIIFWPRNAVPFPFLGAAQVKHRQNVRRKESPATVREFAAAISGHPFSAGLLVSNTSFSADAEWFARERAKLVRLRGFDDVRRWLLGKFDDAAEWREIPRSIELCPGVIVDIR